MKKSILLFLNLVFAAGPILAQGNLGQAGANFLQIGVDPRGAALGGAVTAISSGAAALDWNPAGAIHAQNLDVYLANTDWFMDTRLVYGAVVKNMGSLGAFGLSVTSFYMDEMEITSWEASEGTGQSYDAGDIAIGASYARSLTDRFTFGVTGKYVREYIWTVNTSQIAIDVGSEYRTDFYHLRLGMAVRNFSGKMQFEGDKIDERIEEEMIRDQNNNPRVERLTPEFRLPQIFQLGVAFDPVHNANHRLTLIADVYVPGDNDERLTLASEYSFQNLAFLRASYRINYDLGDLSVGGGFNLSAIGLNSTLDYAYSTHGVMGGVHRIGFGFSF